MVRPIFVTFEFASSSHVLCQILGSWFLNSVLIFGAFHSILFLCWYDCFCYCASSCVFSYFFNNRSIVFICSPKNIDFRKYELPKGVSSVVPSGLNSIHHSKCYLFDHCAQTILCIIPLIWVLMMFTVLHQGLWKLLTGLKAMAIPCHHTTRARMWAIAFNIVVISLVNFCMVNFWSCFSKQSMGDCYTDLKNALVIYLLGKGILMVTQAVFLQSVSGRYFRKIYVARHISRYVVSLVSFKGVFLL